MFAGVRVGGQSLLYAKDGYSNGRVRLAYTEPAFPEDDVAIRRGTNDCHLGGNAQQSSKGNAAGKLEDNHTCYSRIAAE